MEGAVLALATAAEARPWRRSAVDAATHADLLRKLRACVREQAPICFAVPFGGYKGWQVPGAPHLNWAEVMWLDYLAAYASRLAALHPPGVVVQLTCLRGVLGWLNHLPDGQQDTYLAELQTLLAHKSTPRLQFALVDLAAEVPDVPALLDDWSAQALTAPMPTPAQLASAARNLVPDHDGQTLDQTDDARWRAAIEQAARRCAVMEAWPPRRAFNKLGPRIQLTHVRGASLSLHLGSCRSGVAQPWVATGALQWQPDSQTWLERLYTPQTLPPLQWLAVDHPLTARLPGLRSLPVLMDAADARES